MAEIGGDELADVSEITAAQESKAVTSADRPGDTSRSPDKEVPELSTSESFRSFVRQLPLREPCTEGGRPSSIGQKEDQSGSSTAQGQAKSRFLGTTCVMEGEGGEPSAAHSKGKSTIEAIHYKMESNPRGYALLLSNTNFRRFSYRKAGDVDLHNLRKLWSDLLFIPYVLEEKTAQEIKDEIQKFSQLEEHGQMDCCVVVLMSQGLHGKIFGTDDNPVDLDDIFAMFDIDNCPHLMGKPKLFFIQTCRGHRFIAPVGVFEMVGQVEVEADVGGEEMDKPASPQATGFSQDSSEDEPDGAEMSPTGPDMLYAFATRLGYVSFRNSVSGTWFIQDIIEVFLKHAKDTSLLEMMTMVEHKVFNRTASSRDPLLHGAKQQPKFCSSLRKTLYFFPESASLPSVPLEVDIAGPELRALYDRACEEGYTEVYSTRLVLIGKFGNGKTNLCNSLLGDDFDPEWHITDGIAIHPCVMAQEQVWRKLEGQQDHLPYAVAQAMERLRDEGRKEAQPSSSDMDSQGQNESDSLNTTSSAEIKSMDQGSASQVPELTDQQMASSEDQPAQPQPYLKAAKIFKEKDDHSKFTGTKEHPNISIWDFGGQEVFYTTQQVFYTHRAIYGMTLNLTKPLDSPIEATSDGPACHCQSEKDFIDYHLESMRVHTRPALPNTKSRQTQGARDFEPPVLFFFTHKDKVTKKIERKYHSDTKAHLEGKAIDKHVIDKYFSVDNTKRNPEDPEVTEVRKFILDLARHQSYMGEKIPIRWLELKSKLQVMYKQGKKYCSLREVMEAIGSPLASEENATRILTFWYLYGDILFFPVPSLHNFVILDPQWFVDVCKTIITIPQYRDREVKEEWDRLQKTGELRDHLIEYVWRHNEEALRYNLIDHKQELLAMMEKFDLILRCHVNDDGDCGPEEATFFVPSLLTTVSDDAKLYPRNTACSKPIFIVFDGKFCPVGLYHRLVISSMRRYFNMKPQLAYASCAKFITANRMQTFLITKEKFYLKVELVSSVQDEASRFSHGPSVREGIEEDLTEIIDKWVPSIRYGWNLRCSCGDHKDKEDVDRFLPVSDVCITECYKAGLVVCGPYAPATTTIKDIGLSHWFRNPLPERLSSQPARPSSDEGSAEDLEELIRQNYPLLRRRLQVSDLFPLLIQRRLLQLHEKEEIESKPTGQEKAEALLDLLSRQGKCTCEVFRDVLMRGHHQHIAAFLWGNTRGTDGESESSTSSSGTEVKLPIRHGKESGVGKSCSKRSVKQRKQKKKASKAVEISNSSDEEVSKPSTKRPKLKQPSRRIAKKTTTTDMTKYFDKVVKEASSNWDNLARKLKFNENEIEEMETDRPGQRRRCREMLRRWRNRDGQAATLQALKKALKNISQRHLAERLEEPSDSSESTDA